MMAESIDVLAEISGHIERKAARLAREQVDAAYEAVDLAMRDMPSISYKGVTLGELLGNIRDELIKNKTEWKKKVIARELVLGEKA